MRKFILLFILFSTAPFLKISAQIDIDIEKNLDPYSNSVILKHYTANELNLIESNDSIKFNSIIYYYTQSFSIVKVDCPTCGEFDISKFDISDYEHMRKRSERFERHAEKYGFILTLFSIDELTYKLPIHIQ